MQPQVVSYCWPHDHFSHQLCALSIILMGQEIMKLQKLCSMHHIDTQDSCLLLEAFPEYAVYKCMCPASHTQCVIVLAISYDFVLLMKVFSFITIVGNGMTHQVLLAPSHCNTVHDLCSLLQLCTNHTWHVSWFLSKLTLTIKVLAYILGMYFC